MNKLELIKTLRELTGAGMSDCKLAIEESNSDLDKAIDFIKTKNLNIISEREGKVATEGAIMVMSSSDDKDAVAIEVNCQTDFVSNTQEFQDFIKEITFGFLSSLKTNVPKHLNDLQLAIPVGSGSDILSKTADELRKELISKTKENIVIRRWWAEESGPNCKVFTYTHSNNKIGVILSMQAPSEEALQSEEFNNLGNDLAMQVAAMNPLAVSRDRLTEDQINRQKTIFETQLKEMNKPQQAWAKILEGKLNKWYSEVCLMDQESVLVSKMKVSDLVKLASDKLGGDIKVVNVIRAEVGEGILK